MRIGAWIAAGLMLAGASAEARAPDAAFERAAERIFAIAEAVQQMAGASPALALVAVRAEGPPRIWAEGTVAADGELPAGEGTPFYIASMTKAYVGLLAAELDRKGVLALDTRLDAIWPGLAIEGVADPGAVTMQELLSHRIPFRNQTLVFRTAYADEPPPSEWRALLEAFSSPREPSFAYTNLGYLLYGAAVEARTGRHWRDVLTGEILAPLGLDRTSPFPSRFPPGTAAGGHQWLLDGFQPSPLKPDPLMHAAGGLVASPADMARWLQAWLRGRSETVPAQSFARAAAPLSSFQEDDGGIPCTGYALGWRICEIGGAPVRLHGGGYTGVRSAMAWSGALDAGFAMLSNSDSMTGGLSQELTRLFFTALADPEAELPAPAEFAARYAERVRRLAENRRRAVAERLAHEQWAGWRWEPDAAELGRHAGDYRHPRLGRMRVAREGDRLVARLGEVRMILEPAAPGLFGGYENLLDAPDPVRFERDAAGRPNAFSWQDERFVRLPD